MFGRKVSRERNGIFEDLEGRMGVLYWNYRKLLKIAEVESTRENNSS